MILRNYLKMWLGGVKINTERLPELMTIVELMEYFDITANTAYNLVKRRNFPAFKIGREWRINKDDLPNWERARAKQP